MACLIAEQLQGCDGKSGRSTGALQATNSTYRNSGKNTATVAYQENC